MLNGNIYEISIVTVSLLFSCFAYYLIVRKDKSWINWTTPFFISALGSRYVFPLVWLSLGNKPGGSHYAFFYIYTSYAFSILCSAFVYAYIKPIKLREVSFQVETLGAMAWVLLMLGILLYMPILIEFRAYITDPRRIYELTRTGYGLYFYTSTLFATLGFVTYLFYKSKSFLGSAAFYSLVVISTVLHGSKGQILNYSLIWIVYRVYIERKRVGALLAGSLIGTAAVIVIGSFILFIGKSDVPLLTIMLDYADTTRSAMHIIDDPHAEYYYGRLTVENEIYARIPRIIMPNKPADYGQFLLAKKYDPYAYRLGQGTPAYDIGGTYADFGPFTIIYLCVTSAVMAWLVSTLVADIYKRPDIGRFIIFIFLAGVNVIPISGVFLLPETIVVASVLNYALKFRFLRGRLSIRNFILSS